MKDSILIGEVAARGATMLDMRCGRRERHGRLSVARLLAEHGPDVPARRAWPDRIGDWPNRDHTQLQSRGDPYSPTLAQTVWHTQKDATEARTNQIVLGPFRTFIVLASR